MSRYYSCPFQYWALRSSINLSITFLNTHTNLNVLFETLWYFQLHVLWFLTYSLHLKVFLWQFGTIFRRFKQQFKASWRRLTSDISSSAQRSCSERFKQQCKASWHQVYHPLLKDHVLNVLNNNVKPVDIRCIILCSKVKFWTF